MVIPMRRLRKLMLATLFSGLATALFIAPLYADTNVDFTATVQKDTCQIEIDGNGTVSLATVGPSYFAEASRRKRTTGAARNF